MFIGDDRKAADVANCGGWHIDSPTKRQDLVGGRVNVGKSKLYVPYYGNISSDPTHPGVQGTAGIAYGFRTWDISVLNGNMGTQQAPVPGVDTPKVNPALSLSIRF